VNNLDGAIARRLLGILATPEASPARPAIEAGLRIGKYDCERLLGQGGGGEVWLARDRELGRPVALKFLRSAGLEELERFRREAQTAARLAHPNIAAVYEVGDHAGLPFIAMQFVPGRTVDALGPKDRKLALRLVRDAALAVDHAHRSGVIHRDLKPGNLMVEDGTSRLYVLDFGLARESQPSQDLTGTGRLLGTPAYLSPEQARGGGATTSSDVWALGATLYTLWAGRPPFVGKDLYDLLRRIVEEEPIPLRKLDPRTGADLETLTLTCLEKDPARRYPSAAALAEDLSRLLEGEAIRARPPTVLHRLGRILRRRAAIVGVGAGGLLLAAGVALWTIPRWIAETRARERAAQARLEELERADRARPHLEAGRRILEQAALRRRERDHLAEDLARLGQEAVREFDRALAASSDLPEALLGKSKGLELQGQGPSAMATLDRLIRVSPGFATAYLDRVRLLLPTYEGLRHRSDGGPSPEDDASRSLRRRIEADLGQVERLTAEVSEQELARGTLSFSTGDYAQAARELGQYVRSAPADPVGQYLLGHALYHLNRHAEAIVPLSKALEADTRMEAAWRTRALSRKATGDRSGAMADLNRALEILPIPEGYWNRGVLKQEDGDLEGAVRDYDRLLELSPEEAKALTNRGTALSELGRTSEALASYTRALDVAERHPGPLSSEAMKRALQGRSQILRDRKDFKGSREDLERLVGLEPQYATGWSERGLTKAFQGDVDGALEDFERAVRLDGSLRVARFNRACINLSKHRVPEALDDFDRLVSADPRDPEYYFRRSETRFAAGDRAGSIEDLRSALKVAGPQWPHRRTAREVLDDLEKGR